MKQIKFNYLIMLATTIFFMPSLGAEALITTYLVLPPQEVITAVKRNLMEQQPAVASTVGKYVDQQPPTKIATKIVQGKLRSNMLPHVGGFPVIYQGFIDYSDADGQIQLPLRHTSPKLTILITSKITLDTIKGNTISHTELAKNDAKTGKSTNMQLVKGAPVSVYTCEKKKDESNLLFWNISQGDIPKDGKISPITMVILTNPANIYVPLGHFMSTDSPQFILPNLYVVGKQEKEKVIIDSLKDKRFFEAVEVEETKKSDTTNQRITNNS